MILIKLFKAIKYQFKYWKLHRNYGASRRTAISEGWRHLKEDLGGRI